MADGVQEIIPGVQTDGDLSASRLKTLNIIQIIGSEKSVGALCQDSIWIKYLNIYENQRLGDLTPFPLLCF